MPEVYVAKVKNVLSTDTFVLVPSKSKLTPPPERLLTLSYVRADESFKLKEEVRQLLIGKEIKFKVDYKGSANQREFGDIQSPIFKSLIEYSLEKGWVKLKENIQEDSEFIDNLHQIEEKARRNNAGVWDANLAKQNPQVVDLNESIITKSQKSPISAIVERVISGDRVVARIIASGSQHVSTVLLLAAIKCPRTDDQSQPASSLKIAQLAKHFVEEKLLTTKAAIRVSIIGKSNTDVPIAIFHHPSGNNIQEKILESGYAEIVDWQSTLVGAEMMGTFRKAEQTAKALGKGLYANLSVDKSAKSVSGTRSLKTGATIENVQVTRIISGDTFNVKLPNSSEDMTVQLASLRAPRPSDITLTTDTSTQQAIVATSKDFLRQNLIGKTGSLFIDGYREANKDLNLDFRFLVSFKINGNTDISELVVSKGMATVLRPGKSNTHERSMNWDKLIEIEEFQKKTGQNGVFYSGKDISKIIKVSKRIVDASENAAKSKTFFNGFKQKGRVGGYFVEHVSSVNRVRLLNNKEGLKLTLVLGGLANSKQGEASEAGLEFMNKKVLQRSVEFEIYGSDKLGNFVGNLYPSSKSLLPIQVNLLELGYVKIFDAAVGANSFCEDLIKAEEEAKSTKKGLWSEYDEAAEAATVAEQAAKVSNLSLEAATPSFFDIEVSEIDSSGVLYYHRTDQATYANFSKFKSEFNEFHTQPASASSSSATLPFNISKPPKKGDLVSAKYSENGKYYRAKVVSFDRASNKFEVKHLDFGNVDRVSIASLRTLPSQFSPSKIPPFAHTATLQNLSLPPDQPKDYLTEAIYALEDLLFDKKLVISALPSQTPGVEYDVIIYDSDKSLKDSSYTINKQLVSEGLALVTNKNTSPSLRDYQNGLLEAQREAKAIHSGCWEFGDIAVDEDAI